MKTIQRLALALLSLMCALSAAAADLKVGLSTSLSGPAASIGIPVGALFVLWFWKFGAAPTEEQRAANAARLEREKPIPAPAWKVYTLAGAYFMGVIALGILGDSLRNLNQDWAIRGSVPMPWILPVLSGLLGLFVFLGIEAWLRRLWKAPLEHSALVAATARCERWRAASRGNDQPPTTRLK